MNRTGGTTDQAEPWSVRIAVEQIPDTGLHRDLKAEASVCDAMAELAGVRSITAASASFDIISAGGGRFHVTGRVQARIGQTCVVTLDPIENDIDEAIDLIFAPPDQIPELADLVDDAADGETDVPDPPEPIEFGMIDIGRVATDAMFLAIDPYPRKLDAVFEPLVVAADPEDHPFAALKALKVEAEPAGGKKPNKR